MAFTVTQNGATVASTALTPTQQAARERAINMLVGHTNQAQPAVPNQNQVSPEEAGAIKAPESQVSEKIQESKSTESEGVETSGQNDKVDEAAPKEVTKEPQQLSQQYAQLARKEKALRAQVNEIKAKEQAISQREEALKAKESFDPSKYISKEELLKSPLDVLMKNGMTYEQLTQQALNAPSPEQQALHSVIEELRSEIRTLRDDQQGVKKTFEETQQQGYEQAVNNIRKEVKSLVEKDPEFETIKSTGQIEEVVDLIKKTFAEDGVLLTAEEAAKMVEDHIIEEAEKLYKISKIQKRLSITPASTPVEKKQNVEAKQPQAMKTLTNTVSATRPMTSREKAIAAFNANAQARANKK